MVIAQRLPIIIFKEEPNKANFKFMKSAQKIKAGLILISLVLGVGVGNASGFEGTLDSLNSQNFPFIFLNTRVTDNGTAITDLTADNFQIGWASRAVSRRTFRDVA